MFERRTKPRYRLRDPIVIKVRSLLSARMLDLSPEGALLELLNPLPSKLPCDLRIQYGSEDLVVSGQTRRCRGGRAPIDGQGRKTQYYLVGIQFNDAAYEPVRSLLSHIPSSLLEEERKDDLEFGAGEVEYTDGTRWISPEDITVSVHVPGGDAVEPHPMTLPEEVFGFRRPGR